MAECVELLNKEDLVWRGTYFPNPDAKAPSEFSHPSVNSKGARAVAAKSANSNSQTFCCKQCEESTGSETVGFYCCKVCSTNKCVITHAPGCSHKRRTNNTQSKPSSKSSYYRGGNNDGKKRKRNENEEDENDDESDDESTRSSRSSKRSKPNNNSNSTPTKKKKDTNAAKKKSSPAPKVGRKARLVFSEEDHDPVIRRVKRAKRANEVEDSIDVPSDEEEDELDNIMIVDSGADEHLIKDETLLSTTYSKMYIPELKAANGSSIGTTAIGKINELIDKVIVCPKVEENLLSVIKMLKKGMWVIFAPTDVDLLPDDPQIGGVICDADGKICLTVDRNMRTDVRDYNNDNRKSINLPFSNSRNDDINYYRRIEDLLYETYYYKQGLWFASFISRGRPRNVYALCWTSIHGRHVVYSRDLPQLPSHTGSNS